MKDPKIPSQEILHKIREESARKIRFAEKVIHTIIQKSSAPIAISQREQEKPICDILQYNEAASNFIKSEQDLMKYYFSSGQLGIDEKHKLITMSELPDIDSITEVVAKTTESQTEKLKDESTDPSRDSEGFDVRWNFVIDKECVQKEAASFRLKNAEAQRLKTKKIADLSH